jgi:hypothetical protein
LNDFILKVFITIPIVVAILSIAPPDTPLLRRILKLVEHLLILLAAYDLLRLSRLYLTNLAVDSHALIIPASVLVDSIHIILVIKQDDWTFTNHAFSLLVEIISYTFKELA